MPSSLKSTQSTASVVSVESDSTREWRAKKREELRLVKLMREAKEAEEAKRKAESYSKNRNDGETDDNTDWKTRYLELREKNVAQEKETERLTSLLQKGRLDFREFRETSDENLKKLKEIHNNEMKQLKGRNTALKKEMVKKEEEQQRNMNRIRMENRELKDKFNDVIDNFNAYSVTMTKHCGKNRNVDRQKRSKKSVGKKSKLENSHKSNHRSLKMSKKKEKSKQWKLNIKAISREQVHLNMFDIVHSVYLTKPESFENSMEKCIFKKFEEEGKEERAGNGGKTAEEEKEDSSDA